MNRTFIRVLRRPKVENPILIAGFPGIGEVGNIATKMFITFHQAEPFAELYSPIFQDLVFIDENGVCRPPRYEFYKIEKERDFVAMTGDGYPSFDDISGHYEVCSEILDFIEELGCKSIITIDGAPTTLSQEELYVAATSKEVALQYLRRGAKLFRNKRILGLSGLILGLAERHGLTGACLLASTPGYSRDRKAAFRVYKFLEDFLK